MAIRTGNKIFNTVRRYSNNTYVESKTLDYDTLENTYGGDVEAYLQALFPTMNSQQASDLESTQTEEDLNSCPTCGITVSILPMSTESRALTVGAFWPDNNPTIWLSKDSGESWVRQYRDTNKTNVVISDVSFPAGNAAYVTLSDGNVMKSVDGGSTWNNLTLPATASWISCYFTNALTGYVIGEGIILKTIDGGSTWSTLTNPSTNTAFTKVYCVDNDDMETYIVGDTLLILKTEDGGSTWSDYSLQSAQPLADTITDISMESSEVGYFVVNGGAVYETTDFGVTWTAVAIPSGAGWSIHATAKNTSYAGHSPYKITKTTASWTSATITAGNVMFYPNSIASSYSNTNLMLVAGEATQQNNFIFKTTDAFTSKYAVASESNTAGNASAVELTTYSTSTALRFSIAGATTTVTAELLLSDNTIIATKTNLFNGINSFSNVAENLYKIRITDDLDGTCTFTSDTYNYSISYCVRPGTVSQINADKTTTVYWTVITSDTSSVQTDTTVNAVIDPGNDNVTFTILAGENSATLIKTYDKVDGSTTTYTLTLQSGTGYDICDVTSTSITIPELIGTIYGSKTAYESTHMEDEVTGNIEALVLPNIQPILYPTGNTAIITFWQNSTGTVPFTAADENPIQVTVYNRSKTSTGSWGTALLTMDPYETATDGGYSCNTGVFDWYFQVENT